MCASGILAASNAKVFDSVCHACCEFFGNVRTFAGSFFSFGHSVFVWAIHTDKGDAGRVRHPAFRYLFPFDGIWDLIFRKQHGILLKRKGECRMKKQNEEPLYDSFCLYCEHASVSEEEDTVFCKKKKKAMPQNGHCHSFFYDLRKREPKLFSLPEVELPII